jgi:hypothetical protein
MATRFGTEGRRFKSSRPDSWIPQKRPDSFGSSAFRVSEDVAQDGSSQNADQ